MGNPFDFLTGGDNSTSSPGGTPLSPQEAANGPSIMNRMFNPDKGGVLGFIGDMTGQHSNAERLGAVDAGVMQKLSGFYEANGGDAQRSILSLLNDPVGHDLMSRPGASDTLERWYKTVQPTVTNTPAGSAQSVIQNGKVTQGAPVPPAEAQNYNAGVPSTANTPAGTDTSIIQKQGNGQAGVSQTINGPARVATTGAGDTTQGYGPDGRPIAGSATSVPTPQAQNFAYFSQFFNGASADEMAVIAKNQLPGADPAQLTNTIRGMQQRGVIDQDRADKILSGQLVVTPVFGADGNDTHMMSLFDKTTGRTTLMNPTPGPNPSGGPQSLIVPSAEPNGAPTVFPAAAKNTDGTYDADKLISADPKKNMFLGSGLGNHVLAVAGQIVRSTVDPRNPEQSSQLSAFRHDAMDQFQTAVAQLGSLHNNRLAAVVQRWIEDTPSKFTDPVDAYNQAIGLRTRLESIKTANDGYLDPNRGGGPLRYAPKILQERSEENIAVNNVLSAMPSIPDMQDMIKKIQVLPGTALGLGGVVKGVGGLVGGMVTDALGGSGGGSGDGAAVRATRLRERNAAQGGTQPQAPTAKGPTVKDIGTMDLPTAKQAAQTLTPGSPEWDALKTRLQTLSAAKKPTTGQGNPPAAGQSNYDLQPANPQGKAATPGLEDWLQNPAGERNIRQQQPGETIQGAKYGSDGNWHVQQDGKWVTILPPPKAGKKTSSNIGSIMQ